MRQILPLFAALLLVTAVGCSDDVDPDTDAGTTPANGDVQTGDADDTGDHLDTNGGDDADLDAGDDDTSAEDAGDEDTGDLDAGDDGDAGDVDADLDAGSGDAADADDATDTGDTTDTADAGDSPPDGLSEPCENGDGWTLFRFHYELNPGSSTIEVWDASCTYSVGDQGCQIQEVTSGFGDIPTTSEGYPIVNTSSNFIRIRFSVEDLDFDDVSAHVRARSYSTSSSTDMRLETQLHGATTAGPVSQAFTYDWYDIDFTGYLTPNDDPGLTAIDVFADQGGSSEMAVRAMEVCVE